MTLLIVALMVVAALLAFGLSLLKAGAEADAAQTLVQTDCCRALRSVLEVAPFDEVRGFQCLPGTGCRSKVIDFKTAS